MAKIHPYVREAGEIILNLVALGLLLSLVAAVGTIYGAYRIGALHF